MGDRPAIVHEGSDHLVLMLISVGLGASVGRICRAHLIRAVQVASRACRLHSHLALMLLVGCWL